MPLSSTPTEDSAPLALRVKWVAGDALTHAELILDGLESGEGNSVLYHGADWPISGDHKALIVTALNALKPMREALQRARGVLEVLDHPSASRTALAFMSKGQPIGSIIDAALKLAGDAT